MKSEYRKLIRKSKSVEDTKEVVMNLLSDLLVRVSVSGSRSTAEAMAVVLNCDRDYQALIACSNFNIPKLGFRTALLTGFDEPVTESIFRHLGWDIKLARLSDEPWEDICTQCTTV